jgi:hypothetical protein
MNASAAEAVAVIVSSLVVDEEAAVSDADDVAVDASEAVVPVAAHPLNKRAASSNTAAIHTALVRGDRCRTRSWWMLFVMDTNVGSPPWFFPCTG